jgi:hypothetical protein
MRNSINKLFSDKRENHLEVSVKARASRLIRENLEDLMPRDN